MVRRRVVLSQCSMLLPMLLASVVVLVTFEPIAQRASGAETVVIPSEPIKIKPGSPLSGRALVQRPASINGLMSWTLETRRHRGVIYHVAISPDGKTLATGGLDGSERRTTPGWFWQDARTGGRDAHPTRNRRDARPAGVHRRV